MHAVRIDEILLRRGGSGLVKIIAPPIPAHQENALGRPFGFFCVNIPRSPQTDALASEAETAVEKAYATGSLRPGETPEQFFEAAVGKLRESVAAGIAGARLRIDPSLMTVALACVAGQSIYITRHGQAEAYLLRRVPGQPAKIVDIFRGYSESSEDGRLLNDLIVGSVTENDLLLIATKSLFDLCPIADIVEAVKDSEPAAVAARIRSMVIASPGSETVAGCLMRLSPVRPMFRAKENASVKDLRSREEDVARTLSPSGLPGVGAFLERIKNRPPKPLPSPSRRTQPLPSRAAALPSRPAAKPLPKLAAAKDRRPLIERFNSLPTAARRGAIALLALLAVFAVSLKLISDQNGRKAAVKRFESSVQAVRKQIELSESTLIYDEARARSILEDAKSATAKLDEATPAEKSAKAGLQDAIASADRRLRRLYDVSATTIQALSSGSTFILKTASGYLTDSGADLIALDANGSAKSIATLPASPLWAAQSPDDGTAYIWLANGTLVSVDGKSLPRSLDYAGPESPRSGAAWSGRLYALSADGKQIWKLPATLTGFGRGSAYLASPLGGGAAALAIDGSVYAAVAGDAVRSFSKGKMDAFAAGGATANASPASLALGANGIYLLGADGTVAAWDKSGKLLAQYALPKDGGKPTAIAVDETAKQIIYATDKGVIARFEMAK